MVNRTDRARPSRYAASGNANKVEACARIAAEAARLITESGVRDYAHARQKAAERLGIDDESAQPRSRDVEDALREHQRLFQPAHQSARLHELRIAAVEAMRFFEEFQPRLMGAVLDGTADDHSAVCLHLFSDDPDAPMRFLEERGIRHALRDRRVRFARDEFANFPAITFEADGTSIDLTIFPVDSLRRAPLDRNNDKPMLRASIAAVRRLIESTGPT